MANTSSPCAPEGRSALEGLRWLQSERSQKKKYMLCNPPVEYSRTGSPSAVPAGLEAVWGEGRSVGWEVSVVWVQ